MSDDLRPEVDERPELRITARDMVGLDDFESRAMAFCRDSVRMGYDIIVRIEDGWFATVFFGRTLQPDDV